jgi:hypothetical protein
VALFIADGVVITAIGLRTQGDSSAGLLRDRGTDAKPELLAGDFAIRRILFRSMPELPHGLAPRATAMHPVAGEDRSRSRSRC